MSKFFAAGFLFLWFAAVLPGWSLPGQAEREVLKRMSHHHFLKNFRRDSNDSTTYLAEGRLVEKCGDGITRTSNVVWKLRSTSGKRVTEEICEITSPPASIDCSHRDSYTLNALRMVYSSDIQDDFMDAVKLKEIESGGKVTTLFKGKKYSYKTTGNKLTITSAGSHPSH
ncbi:MAG: hypothetical protein IT343_04100 [Candidatus Melainabacteria bacterium]|nr:hypothetical protein [Candidatus Melainabacteria bacterium]